MKQSYILILLSFFSISLLYSQTTHYIDLGATGSQDGTSWSNAFTDIQTAVNAAAPGDELYIAEGKYIIDTSSNGILIEKHLSIYGGFEGTETSSSEADPATHQTIISADRNGDDVAGEVMNKEDNAEHVFLIYTGPQLTRISGVQIEGAYANILGSFASPDGSGGGVFVEGRIHFKDVVFRNNIATHGGGIYLNSNYLGEFESCRFEYNGASRFGGGIFAGEMSSNVRINSCHFMRNVAGASGGGVLAGGSGSSASVENTIFQDNTAAFGGGGFQCDTDGNLFMTGCTFEENSARFGGGLRLQGGAIGIINACEFVKNKAQRNEESQFSFGGGAHVVTDAKATFINCDFLENETSWAGGGLAVGIRSQAFVNYGTLTHNTAGIGAGAMISYLGASITSVQNVYQSNSADSLDGSGGAVVVSEGSFFRIDGDVFTQNFAFEGGAVYANDSSNVEVVNGTFTENFAEFGGAFMLDTDASACIHGSNLNNNRGNISGGAIYTWRGAYTVIDQSIFNMNTGELAAGAIYLDNGNYSLIRNSTFESNRTTNEEVSEVDGGAIFQNNTDLSIQMSRFENNFAGWRGGAIFSLGTYLLKISGSDFIKNTAFSNGGGIAAEQGGTLDIWETNFVENNAFFGGGMCVEGSIQLRIDGGLFDRNTAQGAGGISLIGSDESSLGHITNSRFIGNSNTDEGGDFEFGAAAINHFNMTLSIENSVFAQNDSKDFGPAIWTEDDGTVSNPLTLRNNTFVNNTGGTGVITIGGPDGEREHTVYFQNNIIDNEIENFHFLDEEGSLVSFGGNVSSVDNADVLIHETDQNEQVILYVDEASMNYALTDDSPGVNAGVIPAPVNDILGNERVGAPDAGAYENQNVSEFTSTEVRSSHELDIIVTPNPVRNFMRVILPSDELLEPSIRIISAEGKAVMLQNQILKGNQFIDMSTGDLASGTYMMYLIDDGQIIGQKRFVKI